MWQENWRMKILTELLIINCGFGRKIYLIRVLLIIFVKILCSNSYKYIKKKKNRATIFVIFSIVSLAYE